MGNLINPLSRILGYKNNLFWGNNFSFYYLNGVYKQKIFKIRCFKKLFKYIFRYLFKFLKFPRINYSLVLNFVGQNNRILYINCEVRNLHLYNIASLLKVLKEAELPDLAPKFQYMYGLFTLKSKLRFAINFLQVRLVKIFRRWRIVLLNLYLQKLKDKKQVNKVKKEPINKKLGSSYIKPLYKLKRLIDYFKSIKVSTYKKTYLNNHYSLKYIKIYFQLKMKFATVNLLLLRSQYSKFFMDLFLVFFRMLAPKFIYNFGIKTIKLKFKRKKPKVTSIVRSINHFCFLALRRGYKINYILKVVRYSVRFLKSVRGYQIMVSGRFFRRGKAMNKISTLGEIGSQSGKGFLVYRNFERMKEYGMCSIKILFFFRRKLKIFYKVPLKKNWFNYIKFLRANAKIRATFGNIRY
jgi:hypothetical protein